MPSDTGPDADPETVDVTDIAEITVDRRAGELRLTFGDGVTGSIALAELRLSCPCATCRSLRQQGRPPWPSTPGAGADTLSVTDAELVGAWGLGLTWSDGHATGIYPFEALRAWVVDGEPSIGPDSGLGA